MIHNNIMIMNINNIKHYDNFRYDYDCFDSIGIYTENFTENLDMIEEIITTDHKFYVYLSGLLYFLDIDEILNNIFHAYYLKEFNKLKICVSPKIDRNILTAIYNAWQYYCKSENKDLDVYIYTVDCNRLYLLDDYEIDEKHFNKWMLKQIIKKI